VRRHLGALGAVAVELRDGALWCEDSYGVVCLLAMDVSDEALSHYRVIRALYIPYVKGFPRDQLIRYRLRKRSTGGYGVYHAVMPRGPADRRKTGLASSAG
jgi:hypothetical protein